MKRQAQFTPHELETWAAALSVFATPVINRAVLTAGLSPDPFPDLSKVILACQAICREGQYAPARDPNKIGAVTLEKIAAAMELDV
jgi:hypothetical protein